MLVGNNNSSIGNSEFSSRNVVKTGGKIHVMEITENGWMDGSIDHSMDGCMDGWMDGWMTDRQMDG